MLSKTTVLIIQIRNGAIYSKAVPKVSKEVIVDINDLLEGIATIKFIVSSQETLISGTLHYMIVIFGTHD